MVASGDGEVFVHIHNPALRMVVIGAVHITQALSPMARGRLRPGRGRSAHRLCLAGAVCGIDIDARWPDEALPRMGLDARTAFIALTHDPKIDDPALTSALASDCFYIGALG